ncbi:hypothetical protein MRX96_000227 [Rhipicephalus microplus]
MANIVVSSAGEDSAYGLMEGKDSRSCRAAEIASLKRQSLEGQTLRLELRRIRVGQIMRKWQYGTWSWSSKEYGYSSSVNASLYAKQRLRNQVGRLLRREETTAAMSALTK